MNDGLGLDKALLVALRPSDVTNYLRNRGWILDPANSPRSGQLFRFPTFPDAEALVPLDRKFSDYAGRMADIVLLLSAVETRSPNSVLNDLSTPSNDVVRIRVSADEASLGSLPLGLGLRLYRGLHDLLQSAAHGLVKPQPLHPHHSPVEVRKFLDECRLGQTERGSFVATVLTPPVPPIIPTRTLFGPENHETSEPFPRRVTLRLMDSLDLVAESVRENKLERLVDGVSDGISANLCEALFAMAPPGEQSSLEIGVAWSGSRPISSERIRNQVVVFNQDVFATIEEAGRQLRLRAQAIRQEFAGKVLGVNCLIRTLYEDVAKVTIRAEVDGFNSQVRFDVRSENYRAVCDALRDGSPVRVTGLVHRDARRKVYDLTDPQDFQVLNVG